MRFSSFAFACGPLALLGLAASLPACTEQTTNYGPPEGLKGTNLPTPMGTGTGTGNPPPPAEDSGIAPPPAQDSGSSIMAEDSAVTPPPGDSGSGGPCAVSWSGKIYVDLTSTWGCASSAACHGSGGQNPVMAGTATTVYSTFAAFTAAAGAPGGLPYILPGSTDPSKSSFLCSVSQTGTCGTLMPLGLTPLSTTDLSTITQWIACGTPDN